MADPVVLDAGPLVALINRGDQFHDWAIAQVHTFDAELVTCDAVIADACLVRMSELHDRARVFTLDADFKLYRRHSRQPIPLIYPAP